MSAEPIIHGVNCSCVTKALEAQQVSDATIQRLDDAEPDGQWMVKLYGQFYEEPSDYVGPFATSEEAEAWSTEHLPSRKHPDIERLHRP